jgi:protocatechuate 3,4-dioxygenase beta subunit
MDAAGNSQSGAAPGWASDPCKEMNKRIHYFFIPAVAVCFGSLSQTSAAQASDRHPPTSRQTCSIVGVVLNEKTGEPLPGAEITLRDLELKSAAPFNARTNKSGGFITLLPCGRYGVSVNKLGFLPTPAAGPGQETVTLQPDQQPHDLRIRLIPSSVISGRVLDAAGEALSDVRVQAVASNSAGGGSRTAATALTNDLGEYRIHGLAPGDYYVLAMPPQSAWGSSQYVADTSALENYVRTFYPQSNEMQSAHAIPVHAEEEVSNIDIELLRVTAQVVKTVDLTTMISANDSAETETRGTPTRNGQPSGVLPFSGGSCVVAGQVVDSLTGRPLERAQLTLLGSRAGENVPHITETDSAGHFTIRNVDPGRYRLVAFRSGFSAVVMGSATGQELSLSPKQRVDDILLRITPSSVIAGQVVDQETDPVPDMRVQAFRYSYLGGKRQLHLATTTLTDDRGEYRLHGLPPGSYYVQTVGVSSSDRRDMTTGPSAQHYAATFYPQTTDMTAATPVSVGPGEQAGGIKIAVLATRPASVRGRVVGLSIATGTVLSLLPADGAALGVLNGDATTVKDSQGNFEIRGVLPGMYRLSAIWHHNRDQYAGSRTIEIKDTDLSNIVVGMNRAADILGKIHVEGDQHLNVERLHITIKPQSELVTGTVLASMKSGNAFLLRDVFPEKYELSVMGMPDNFYVKTVQIGNETTLMNSADFSHPSGPINVVLSSNSGTITGSVLDQDQQSFPDAKVVLVPDARDQRQLYKMVISSETGQFKISGVAPGRYKLSAWQNILPDAYFDPEFLETFDRLAESIMVGENASTSAVLQVIQEQ